jgi:hypothetical protein
MICPICMAVGVDSHCAYHVSAMSGDNWAAANKILCDHIHRGVALVRLAPELRLDPGEMPTPVEVAGSFDA